MDRLSRWTDGSRGRGCGWRSTRKTSRSISDSRRWSPREKHGIHSPGTIISYREQNEEQAGARILGFLGQGVSVAICSDAGYPGISDAGYRIISRSLDDGHDVEVLPGAGAIEPALLSSGLPTSSFTFKGFPPRKPGVLRRFLTLDKEQPHTLVFFQSPFRLQKFLEAALEVLGDRRSAV